MLKAKADEGGVKQAALERLFQCYRKPIVRAIQARQRCDEAAAEDLAHDFIAQCLRRDFLRNVQPGLGRFRSFIQKCLTRFLQDQHKHDSADKRGGGLAPLSLDETDEAGTLAFEPPAETAPLDASMDWAWADQILEEAFARLERECVAARRSTLFQTLKSQLGRAEDNASLAEIAVRLGLTEGAVKVALHRLRKRLGELIAEEVKQTVANQAEWRDELRYLLDLLGRRTA